MLGWIKHGLRAANTVPVAIPEVPPSLDQLVEKVRRWGDDRLITKNSTPAAQLLKCMSELGELSDATLKCDREEIVDGVGDVIVTLIMYAATQGVCPRMCLEIAYDAIKDRKGYLTPEGVFVKEE